MIVLHKEVGVKAKLMTVVVGAACAYGAISATLPDWAVGTYKGSVENWCNDSSLSAAGSAVIVISDAGIASGSVTFSDGASGKATGKSREMTVADGEVKMMVGFKWYDERGKADGSSWSSISIYRTSSGATMEFEDDDEEEDDWFDKCPVAGSLEKTSSGYGVPSAWKKARTLNGVFGEGCYVVDGVAQLKCGKANKKGFAKVSLTITPFNGKKRSYKGVAVDVSQGGPIEVRWPQQGYFVRIDGDDFFGEPIYTNVRPACSPNAVWSADIGGKLYGTAMFEFGYSEISELIGRDQLSEYVVDSEHYGEYLILPLFQPVKVKMNGTKWTIPKAAKVKWKACPSNASCIGDWLADTRRGVDNLSGLKLSYNAKTGMFKGSFKLFGFWGKKYTAKVNGLVVEGCGTGVASCPKLFPETWSVFVE